MFDLPIITTGNELIKEQISDFFRLLNLQELYSYITEVKDSTEENAVWLIDYWCNKDIRGLIKMPFSRHWIMHIEACIRILNKIRKGDKRYGFVSSGHTKRLLQ